MRPPRPTQRLVIAGYALGAVAFSWGLPAQGPPPWAAAGHWTLWPDGLMLAFLLPTAAAAIDALLRGLCVNHPIGEPNALAVLAAYDAIMLRFVVFLVGVHAVVLLAVMGLLSGREWAGQLVPVMLGLTIISVGNLLPRTRPNLAIGIRTNRTLADRALWIRTHRSTGYLLVVCGVVIVLSAIAVPRPVGPGMILLVGPAAAIGTYLLLRSAGRDCGA